jgi:hypothetical protein
MPAERAHFGFWQDSLGAKRGWHSQSYGRHRGIGECPDQRPDPTDQGPTEQYVQHQNGAATLHLTSAGDDRRQKIKPDQDCYND